jgi:hypothetical protein
LPSPFRDDAPDVRLRVTTGSPLAEVFLIDHAFALQERAIGTLECVVAPGVYNVKAKLGDAVAEVLMLLDGNRTVHLSRALTIGSAAPLEGTARSRESDRDLAAASAGVVRAAHGFGAEIFLMSRRWAADAGNDGVTAPELELLDAEGRSLPLPLGPPDGHGTVAATVAVAPGAHRLRWADHAGVVAEQAVPAIDGWQTQVFVLEDAGAFDPATRRVPIGRTRVSILMGRRGFDPYEDQLRLVEAARTALADDRKVASDVVGAIVADPSRNPMLMLYGAHLMLLARDAQRSMSAGAGPAADVAFDQDRFDGVVAALGELLGPGDPDVVALATQTAAAHDGMRDVAPVTAPPMLWRSWALLVAASNDAPELVPVPTWRRVRRTLPLRPFLMWSPAGEDDEERWAQELRAALDAERDATRRLVSRDLLAPRAAVDEAAERP